MILRAVLLVAGLWWCKEIFQRLRHDIVEFKTSDDSARRGVIMFFWLTTVVILALIVRFLWGIVRTWIHALS
ncbi:MAG: hypothetical protein IID39_04730 [Planctomycetes bacterium]|nr:hypothetical protein [Planctomycetota bacterium]